MDRHLKHLALIALLIAIPHGHALSENIDKVVAYIDNTAITKRELDERHAQNLAVLPDSPRSQTLEAMINTTLMLIEARKMRLSAANDTELLNKYLDLKVRSMVLITDNEITEYFRNNRERFDKKSLREVKEVIHLYLKEARYNQLLKDHINELRQTAAIKILEQ